MAEKAVKSLRTAKTSEKTERVPPFKERSLHLIHQLHLQMAKNGHGLRDLANIVGVSYPHATALMTGERWWAGTDRDVIEKLADYLGKPVLQIYFWCGFLHKGDQYFKEDLQSRAEMVFERAKNDPYTSTIVCSDEHWRKLPMDVRAMITVLLEAVHSEATLKAAEKEKGLKEGIGAFRREHGIR